MTPASPAPPAPADDPFAGWLAAARAGSRTELGRALDACRVYLQLIAENEIGSTLRPKAGASDLVQDSLLEAQQGFARFTGQTREEFYNWVRAILRNNLTDMARKYRDTGMRAVGRECRLTADRAADDTPTGAAVERDPVVAAEQKARLFAAINKLPEKAREVLSLRRQHNLTWATIGERVGTTEDGARKIWFRAVERLRAELGPPRDARE